MIDGIWEPTPERLLLLLRLTHQAYPADQRSQRIVVLENDQIELRKSNVDYPSF
jgi:hypothetical protein